MAKISKEKIIDCDDLDPKNQKILDILNKDTLKTNDANGNEVTLITDKIEAIRDANGVLLGFKTYRHKQ